MARAVRDNEDDKKKSVLEQVSVPSFFTLLFSVAAVLVGYGSFLNSTCELIAGMFALLFGICSVVFYLKMRKREVCGGKGEGSGYQCRKSEPELPLVSRGAVINILLSIIIAFLIFLRVAFIADDGRELPEADDLYVKVLKVRKQRYNQQLMVKIEGAGVYAALYAPPDADIKVGDIVELDARPRRISVSEKGSSFIEALKRKGAAYQIYLKGGDFRVHSRERLALKEYIRDAIDRNIGILFHKSTAPILRALYFGNKSFIDKDTISSFKRAGALHILAASGLHVGIIASLPFLILGFFKINKRIILLVTIAIVFCYLYITDMPVSLVRACVMFSVYGIQRYFYLDRNIYNTFFIAAIIILALYPYELYGLGFQLTFGATLGIILLFKHCRSMFEFLPELLAKSLSVTLAAQIFVFPIILVSLNEINLSGIISNIALVPGIGIALVVSIIANLVSLLSVSAASFFGYITDSIIHNIRFFVDIVSGLPGHFIPGNEWYYLLVPYVLILLSVMPHFRRRKYSCLLVLFGYIMAWMFLFNNGRMPDARVTRLKNDKSDIALYRKENTGYVAGSFGNFDDVGRVVRLINNSNIKKITLMISDINFENIRYYTGLIKKIPVSRCYLPSGFRFNGFLTQLFSILDLDKVELKVLDVEKRAKESNLLSRNGCSKKQKSKPDSERYNNLKELLRAEGEDVRHVLVE